MNKSFKERKEIFDKEKEVNKSKKKQVLEKNHDDYIIDYAIKMKKKYSDQKVIIISADNGIRSKYFLKFKFFLFNFLQK
jgi:hypothetical protein